MKGQYIKQVKKELHLPRKEKAEVLRDLNEIFASAMEHGETEQQVIERLGTPKEFADSTAAQFGIDNASLQKRKTMLACVFSLLIGAVSFVLYAVARVEIAPVGAIGQADAMTTMQVEGAFGLTTLQIILTVGIIAAVVAVVQGIRLVPKSRR